MSATPENEHLSIPPSKLIIRAKYGIGCLTRTRTDSSDIEDQRVTKANSQIDSQSQKSLEDPDLKRVIDAWESLPENLKMAILAIVGQRVGGEP